MTGRLAGKVAVVTGAAQGLGRAEALALAAEGAAVLVNDLHGADETVGEINATGGQAVSVAGDIAEAATAQHLVDAAVRELGSLDIVVNNAGFLRDKMIFGMSDDDWDAVTRVHLRGHFVLSRAATAYWRDRSKETGGSVYARVINTSSEAGLLGSPGQPNYAAAKAGIIALTLATSQGCARYGVRANAICPRARTAMTAATFDAHEGAGLDPLSPEHVAPFVAFLASPEADPISGQVFVVYGGRVGLVAAPALEQSWTTSGERHTVDELAASVGGYFAGRDPRRTFAATDILTLGV